MARRSAVLRSIANGLPEGEPPMPGCPPQGGAPPAQAYDVIYDDDARVRNPVRYRHLAKSIADAGWSAFLTTLAFTAAAAQEASACGRSRADWPDVSWLWGCGLERPISPLAPMARCGLRCEPAPRPQRRAEHPAHCGTAEEPRRRQSAVSRPSGAKGARYRM